LCFTWKDKSDIPNNRAVHFTRNQKLNPLACHSRMSEVIRSPRNKNIRKSFQCTCRLSSSIVLFIRGTYPQLMLNEMKNLELCRLSKFNFKVNFALKFIMKCVIVSPSPIFRRALKCQTTVGEG
jgi:hypothetical protein